MQEGRRTVEVISSVPNSAEALLFDGIENLLVWSKSAGTNASAAVTKSTAAAYEGASSLLLDTGVTVPAANDLVTATRYAAIGRARYLEITAFFMLPVSGTAEEVTLLTVVGAQGFGSYYGFRYNTVDNLVYYMNSSFSYVAATATAQAILASSWNMVRITIDKLNRKYKQIQLNELTYDLSNITPAQDGGSAAGYVQLNASMATYENTRKLLYLDNVRVRGLDFA